MGSSGFSDLELLKFVLFAERNAEWIGVRPSTSLILTPNLFKEQIIIIIIIAIALFCCDLPEFNIR